MSRPGDEKLSAPASKGRGSALDRINPRMIVVTTLGPYLASSVDDDKGGVSAPHYLRSVPLIYVM